MAEWNKFIGKQIKIMVDDPPSEKPTLKRGILNDYDGIHLFLLKDDNNVEIIRLKDIRRMLVVEDGDYKSR